MLANLQGLLTKIQMAETDALVSSVSATVEPLYCDPGHFSCEVFLFQR